MQLLFIHVHVHVQQIEEFLVLTLCRSLFVDGLTFNYGSQPAIRRTHVGWPSVEVLGEVVSGGGEIISGLRVRIEASNPY